MATVTTNTAVSSAVPVNAALPTQRIEPPSGWFELRLGEVWNQRELLYFLVWREVKVRYKQTALGVIWVILQPLLTMLVATIFFGRLAKLPSQGLPYSVFCFAGLVPWTYFSTSIVNVTNVVVDNQRLITKVYFPRLILPLSAAFAALVDFGIAFVVLIVFTLLHGIRPGWTVLFLPLFLLLEIATVMGVGLFLSALNALYRDVRFLMPFIVQFWTLASPVYYSSTMVPARYRWIYGLNPMTGVIDGFRWALTGTGPAPTATLITSTVMVLVGLAAGLLYFNRMEGAIADRV